MRKILYMASFCLLAACSNKPVEYYKYTPLSANESPASIKGAAIDSKIYSSHVGIVYVKAIDGKYIENTDNGGFSKILGPIATAASMDGTSYPITAGKHVITATLSHNVSADFEIVLNAVAGERYSFKAVNLKTGHLSLPSFQVWIEDSKGNPVTSVQSYDVGYKRRY